MIPYLKKKNQPGVSTPMVKKFNSGGMLEMPKAKEAYEDPGLLMIAEHLCKSIDAKDYAGIAKALQYAFELLDAMPHEEGPHLDENE